MSDAVDIKVRGLSKAYGKNRRAEGRVLPRAGRVDAVSAAALRMRQEHDAVDPRGDHGSADGAGASSAGPDDEQRGDAPRRVGVVFQSYALFPHMTCSRNVEFGPRVQGQDKSECADAAERARCS